MPFENSEQAKRHLVRLFPTIRIGSTAEAETRATAALLATLRAVSEFGRVLVKLAGGPAGKPDCYTEVPYIDQSQTPPLSLRPDGLLVVSRAGKTWRCLVEVKVGNSPIERDQVEKYLQLAKQEEISALITVSNEAGVNGGLPFAGLNKGLLKAVTVVHLSWERLLAEARLLRGQDRVADSDQQWMLDEWIQYVSDPASKIVEPPSLGQYFGDLLTAAKEGNLGGAALAVRDVCGHWDAFLKKVADRLRADLGVDVHPVLSSAEKNDHELRVRNLQTVVVGESRLAGALKIRNAAADISINVLLPARAVRFGIELRAPSEGRQQTRVKWMIRQLNKAPATALLHVHWDQRKLKTQTRVAELATNPLCLTRDVHGQPIPDDALPRSFSIEWTQDLRRGKGRSNAEVLDGIMTDLETFYSQVVEGIVAFVPRAPKMPVASPAEPLVASPAPGLEPEPAAESGEFLVNENSPETAGPVPSEPPPAGPLPRDRAANE